MHDLTFEILAKYAEPLNVGARFKEVERLKSLGETPENLYCSLYANRALCGLVRTGLYKILVAQIADRLSIKNTEDVTCALLYPFTVEMNWTEYAVAAGMLETSATSVRNECAEVILSARAMAVPNKFLSDTLNVMMTTNSLNVRDIADQWNYLSVYKGYNRIPVACYIYRTYLIEHQLLFLEIDKIWYQFDVASLIEMERTSLEERYILSTMFMYTRRATEYTGTKITCGKGMTVQSQQYPNGVPSSVLFGHLLCNACKLYDRFRSASVLPYNTFEAKFRGYRENQTAPLGNVLFYKGSRIALTSASFDILVSVYEGNTVLTVHRVDTTEVITTEARYWKSASLAKRTGMAETIREILSEYIEDIDSAEECLARIMKVKAGVVDD